MLPPASLDEKSSAHQDQVPDTGIGLLANTVGIDSADRITVLIIRSVDIFFLISSSPLFLLFV
jgi:hypothetical protein